MFIYLCIYRSTMQFYSQHPSSLSLSLSSIRTKIFIIHAMMVNLSLHLEINKSQTPSAIYTLQIIWYGHLYSHNNETEFVVYLSKCGFLSLHSGKEATACNTLYFSHLIPSPISLWLLN